VKRLPAFKLRHIDCSTPNAVKQMAELRQQFSNHANIVSPAGRKLTQAVFGEALTPEKVVERICRDVKQRGLPAVLHYTEQLDKVRLTPKMVRISADEMAGAFKAADPEFIQTVRRCRDNVMQFQMGLLSKDAVLTVSEHYELQLRFRPLKRVGICIPGGAAAYPSTLIMTVCPAQAAEVKEIAVVIPPTPNGAANPDMLAVCHALGLKEVYRIGGAQAVAALAYGTDETPAVDMIVGPGNIFVALAKQFVYGTVAIDCIAGPSEIVVVADESAQPEFIAADMIAQAEHSPGVAVLVTWSADLLKEVENELVKQVAKLERGNLARASLADFGAGILVKDAEEAASVVNQLAAEHLHVQTRDPEAFADKIDNAGAIFLGQFTPVALGDYAAGPSHVLPTGGTARFASGLNANDFRKRTSVMNFTRNGLRDVADDVIFLSNKEGLSGHAASVEIRLRDLIPSPRPPKKSPPKPAPMAKAATAKK
jgi:histidinol dehydrogenase